MSNGPDKEDRADIDWSQGRGLFPPAPRQDRRSLRRYSCNPAEELAAEIAEKLIARFVNGETDAVYILYSRFRSALSQVPTWRNFCRCH